MLRRTKIIATLGPATDDAKTLREVITAGLDVARLNFSHGDHDAQRSDLNHCAKPPPIVADSLA